MLIIWWFAFLLYHTPTAICNDFAFTSSGSLKHLEFFQKKVIDNINEATALAFSFDNTTIMIAIQKYDPLRHESSYIIRKSHILYSIIGWNADCLAAYRLISALSLQYFTEFCEEIDPSTLALQLADDAQARTMDSNTRPLAMNALLFGINTPIASPIYKVDVTGNFWKCQSASIGRHSNGVEGWMRSKGVKIVSAESERIRISDNHELPDSTICSSERFCLDLAWNCLTEVIGTSLSNFCLEISSHSNGITKGPHRIFVKAGAGGGVIPTIHLPKTGFTRELTAENISEASLLDVWITINNSLTSIDIMRND